MKRAFADIPEGQMHYRVEGSGEPVILLHPGVGSSDAFTNAIPYMSGKYLIIAPDFLGNGDSDPAPYQYTMLDHARSLYSFMDSLGLRKVNIVGHHTGAKVAAELAINWPERVNKLVLSAIGYWEATANIDKKEPDNFTTSVEIKPDGSHLMEWWERSALWGHPLDITHDRAVEYIKAGPRGEEIHWAGRNYDPRPRLPLIKCPTLVVSATRDPFCVVAENVHKLVPGSKLNIIKNGPIDIDRVWPKEFAEAVLSFLNTTSA